MTVDTNALDVDEAVTCCKLLCCNNLIFQAVVSQVTVAVVVIPLRAVGVTTAVTYGDYDEAQLRKAVSTNHRVIP